jgi:hypothetical protein
MSSEATPESGGESGSDPGVLTKAYDALSPQYLPRPDAEMDTIGWSIFLGMVVILLPLLPFLVVGWVITKMLDALTPRSPGS